MQIQEKRKFHGSSFREEREIEGILAQDLKHVLNPGTPQHSQTSKVNSKDKAKELVVSG